jgi:hypothetical protein
MRVYEKILNGMLTFFMLLLVLTVPIHVLGEQTIVSVYPSASYVEVGSTFSVNVTVSNVYDLVGWEFKLYYLSAKLNGTSVAEGPFLKQGGNTFFYVVNFTDNYNATHGMVWLTCTLLGAVPGVSGNGTLATITFRAREPGSSSLMLKDTLLSDSKANPIAHTVVHGTAYILTHDIAIAKVSPSKSIVGQGLTVKIGITLQNEGNYTETLSITIYSDTIAIGTLTATIANGSIATVTLTWNTTGWPMGNYTLLAYAWPIQGETDTADNTVSAIMPVHVGVPGNVWGNPNPPPVYDDVCNMRDVTYLILHFNAKPGSPNWDPNSDVNNDGVCNMRDVSIAILNFNKHE